VLGHFFFNDPIPTWKLGDSRQKPGDQEHNRKEWIESRLAELAGNFAVAVGGFSVMNNHLHVECVVNLTPWILGTQASDLFSQHIPRA
jgi:hypothetical protein